MEWRKFYRLLSTMPLESSLFFAPYSNEYAEQQENQDDNHNWYKEELDRRMGRTPKMRTATTIDEMMQDQSSYGIGKE